MRNPLSLTAALLALSLAGGGAAALILHAAVLSLIRVVLPIGRTLPVDPFPNIERMSSVHMPVAVIHMTGVESLDGTTYTVDHSEQGADPTIAHLKDRLEETQGIAPGGYELLDLNG